MSNIDTNQKVRGCEKEMMKDKRWTPFFSWGSCKSQDSKKPDVVDIQVTELELSSTIYSMNAKVNHKDSDGKWYERILPIKNHESFNSDLLKQWEEAFHKGWIKLNGHIRIKTWLETSKRNKD